MSSKPGSNPASIREMMLTLHRAANKAVQTMKDRTTNTCMVIPVTTTRDRAVSKEVPFSAFYYDPSDFTVIGGSVLTLIDKNLSQLQSKHSNYMGTLRNEMQRESLDIDVVWWPRTTLLPDEVVVSTSPCILKIVDAFVEALREEHPAATITHIHRDRIGVHNVEIEMEHQKVVDITIHDSGSSQRYTMFAGEIIGETPPMTDDPIYPRQQFEIDGVRVPPIDQFVEQQLFAYNSFRRMVTDLNRQKQRTVVQKEIETIQEQLSATQKRMVVAQKRIEYVMKWLQLMIVRGTPNNKSSFGTVTGINQADALLSSIQTMVKRHHVPIHVPNVPAVPNAPAVQMVYFDDEKGASLVPAASASSSSAVGIPFRVENINFSRLANQPYVPSQKPQSKKKMKQTNRSSKKAFEEQRQRNIAMAKQRKQEAEEQQKKQEYDHRIQQYIKDRKELTAFIKKHLPEDRKSRILQITKDIHKRLLQFQIAQAQMHYGIFLEEFRRAYREFIMIGQQVKELDRFRSTSPTALEKNRPLYIEQSPDDNYVIIQFLKYAHEHTDDTYDPAMMDPIGQMIEQLYVYIIMYRDKLLKRLDEYMISMENGALLTPIQHEEVLELIHALDPSNYKFIKAENQKEQNAVLRGGRSTRRSRGRGRRITHKSRRVHRRRH